MFSASKMPNQRFKSNRRVTGLRLNDHNRFLLQGIKSCVTTTKSPDKCVEGAARTPVNNTAGSADATAGQHMRLKICSGLGMRKRGNNNHTHASYIELYDPEHGDEQEVKGHKEAEGPPHVRDALFLPGFIRFHPGVDGGSVEGPQPSARQPGLGAAAAAALARHRLRRRPPALNRGRLVLNSGRDEDSLCHHCICRKEQGVVSAHLP